MILYDSIWFYMILYDSIWFYMILYDSIWFYMILYDSIWFYMILYDSIWFYMILYDSIWFYMILYDSMTILLRYIPRFSGRKKTQWSSESSPAEARDVSGCSSNKNSTPSLLTHRPHSWCPAWRRFLRDVKERHTERNILYGWMGPLLIRIIVGLLWDYNGYSDHSNPIDLDSL